ncbi:MAG: EAL domain-containing protein [Lysobacteraceae bacterium]|nr:MAG: EAL domain-containing protein [Xanthomonadaceae bacterium]
MPFDSIDKEKSYFTRPDAPRGFSPWLAAAAAFVLGMSLTLWLSQQEYGRARQEQQRAFAEAASDVTEAIRSQLSDCERLIRTFQSVFIASDDVSPEEFSRVYDNLQDDRARINLQALAYARRVAGNGRERYLTEMFVPRRGNESIEGLDVTQQPTNMRALVQSGDTNQVNMSAPFTLRQSQGLTRQVDGFILRLPVYAVGSQPTTVAGRRQALVGSLGASFRIRDLISGVMPDKADLIAAVLVDDITDGAPRRLHQHLLARAAAQAGHVEEIRFGGRTWVVTVRGTAGLVPSPWRSTTFWLGTLVSTLLAALSWSLVSTRERAIALGSAMGERFRASEERFRKLTELLPSLVLVARRADGAVVYQNAVARDRLGELAGTGAVADLFDEESSAMLFDSPERLSRPADLQIQPLAASPFWANVCVAAIDIDEVPTWLIVASDISEQRQLTERLSYQASHDSLTNVLNRREFEGRISKALATPGPREGALLFIDLDQFKLINDTSGHRAGDELLVQLAAMMREKLRPNDILGRLGGDEFGVLLAGVPSVEAASQAAERLRRSLEGHMFSWEQRTYTTSASIGAVMLSRASTLKELFAHADAACYLAKEAGRNRVHFYSDDDAAITTRMGEMEWASRLREALREGRLLLDYQELHSIQPGGKDKPHVELLLRLRAEDGREVMPGAFLPAAERYGLMPAIDRWVVGTALTNIDRLHPSGSGLATCAINLSSSSLEDAGLFELIADLIQANGLDPGRLLFEITETVAMRDFAASSALISSLRQLGCRVALDDFGAGMSSFGYMKNLELDMVKIDGSFVQELATDRMSQSIVRAVTEIGHQQGLAVVAEWVSSPEMIGLLRQMGVDYAQGFALHKPERVVFQRP